MNRAPRPFAALLWRELVELTRHSAPVFVLYCVFVFLDTKPPATLWQVVQPAERFVWFGLFNVLVGSVFGFFQSSRDRSPDAWALAVHRPVTRTRVFVARVLAGWGTLLVVAGVPWAVAMAWIAVPGHVAVPFDWHMLQPGASDLILGMMAHAGGLLVGARVRGAFSRYLGFVAVIMGGLATASLSAFSGAVVVSVIMTAVLLVAAWATFVSADDRAAQPALGRVANALAVLPACLVLYLIGATTWDAMTLDQSVPFEAPTTPFLQALVTPDGRIIRARIRERSLPIGEIPSVEEAFDLEGRPMPELAKALSGSEAGAGVLTSGQLRTYTTDFYRAGYRNPSRWVQRLATGKRGVIWYYELGRGLISVYDDKTRRRTGWIGPDGFVSGDTPPSRRFEGSLRTTWLTQDEFLVFDEAIYTTSKFPNPPELVFRAPPGDTIADMAMTTFSISRIAGSPGPWTIFRAISTNRAIYIIDDAGRVEIRSPKPPGLPKNALATVWRAYSAPGKPTFVWYPAWADTLNRVLEYRMGHSEPVARYQFPGPMYETRYSGNSLGSRFIARSGGGGLVPMSSSGSMTAFKMDWQIGGGSESERPSRRAIAIALSLSAITMVFIWLIGRRYAFSVKWRAAWMALSLIAGLFTLLAMWLTTDFPARETCPSCGKLRVVNREQCEHCSAGFPAPDRDGTEVFA